MITDNQKHQASVLLQKAYDINLLLDDALDLANSLRTSFDGYTSDIADAVYTLNDSLQTIKYDLEDGSQPLTDAIASSHNQPHSHE